MLLNQRQSQTEALTGEKRPRQQKERKKSMGQLFQMVDAREREHTCARVYTHTHTKREEGGCGIIGQTEQQHYPSLK